MNSAVKFVISFKRIESIEIVVDNFPLNEEKKQETNLENETLN